jgi:hypothetical protein
MYHLPKALASSTYIIAYVTSLSVLLIGVMQYVAGNLGIQPLSNMMSVSVTSFAVGRELHREIKDSVNKKKQKALEIASRNGNAKSILRLLNDSGLLWTNAICRRLKKSRHIITPLLNELEAFGTIKSEIGRAANGHLTRLYSISPDVRDCLGRF